MMTPDSQPSNKADQAAINADTDRLITRIVDGEASADECIRFEQQAAGHTGLWRVLALRQQHAAALAAGVDRAIAPAASVEIPPAMYRDSGPRPRRMWPLAASGWAAAIMVALIWATLTVTHARRATERSIALTKNSGAIATPMTPDEHLREYLRAPFVLAEMPPTLLDLEQLSDGRFAARILRRIEEVIFVDSPQELSLDQQDQLQRPPIELRSLPRPSADMNPPH